MFSDRREGTVMADAVVSFDRDESAAAIARWHAYADQLERYGAPNPAMLAQLRQMLGRHLRRLHRREGFRAAAAVSYTHLTLPTN